MESACVQGRDCRESQTLGMGVVPAMAFLCVSSACSLSSSSNPDGRTLAAAHLQVKDHLMAVMMQTATAEHLL